MNEDHAFSTSTQLSDEIVNSSNFNSDSSDSSIHLKENIQMVGMDHSLKVFNGIDTIWTTQSSSSLVNEVLSYDILFFTNMAS